MSDDAFKARLLSVATAQEVSLALKFKEEWVVFSDDPGYDDGRRTPKGYNALDFALWIAEQIPHRRPSLVRNPVRGPK